MSSVDANSIFRVDGLVAVITGGGSGIGLMMARALAQKGTSKVYILGRRLEVLQKAAEEHPSLIPHQCDVTVKDDLQGIVDRITTEVGYVNLVIANSGNIGPAVRFDRVASISELRQSLFTNFSMDEMNDTLSLNITAAFFTMTAFLEHLNAGNRNSMDGGFGKPVNKGSHAAMMQLTKHASTQLARVGIRVNAIAPRINCGSLSFRSRVGITQGRTPETEASEDQRFIPARRFGGDEEMAGAVLYLSSRAGSFSNGSILVTDGGRLSVIPETY
ncbi:hypothetical protein BDW74DRAFT_188252 [Aspergillus multicolor]|uniref:SDR family NAD(P)-dependent oxidoreductase n=1 Tax=Aspergillus multicolor TaxID=41759 RepID=UPI003CCD2294